MQSENRHPPPPASVGPLITDEGLTEMATDFVLAMLASASTDVIDPKHWWERARTALETSAQASSWPEMVSRCGAKLQIASLSERSSKAISSLGNDLSDTASFRRFRALCKRDALYITAAARVKRDEQKEARKP